MNKPEHNKYIVLKITDIIEYLDEYDIRDLLNPLLDKINAGRVNHGKRENTYLVVNTDEPYALKIQDMILSEGRGWVKLPFQIGTSVIDYDPNATDYDPDSAYRIIQYPNEYRAQCKVERGLRQMKGGATDADTTN